MNKENIVCFAKDWSEDPTSNNHVMRLLGKHNHVLWLNSIATRTPNLASGRDLGKIVKKLKSFAQGSKRVDEGLEVYTPIVLPLPHSRVARLMNEQIVRATVGTLRRSRGMKDFQLWAFLPTAAPYVGKLGESVSVYYCTDEWSHFSSVDSAKIVAMEKDLCSRADLVLTTSEPLLERKRVYNPETHLASHGVDQGHFARALSPDTLIPDEIARLPKPVLGFIGLIEDWIDLDIISHLAERRPDWSIVLIGKAMVDLSRLARYKNVTLLGRKPYAALPEYCKGFDVSLIPFALNELTRNVNPIKLREYFSAGLPCVSTDMPAVRSYADHPGPGLERSCYVAHSKEEFFDSVERALAQDSPAARATRSAAMKNETWEKKVEALGDLVLRVKERKRATT